MGRLRTGTAMRLLAATTLVIGLWFTATAGAAAAAKDGEGADPLGQTLMTAAKASGVLDAIEGSLVYLGAKYEGSSTAAPAAGSPFTPAPATPTR